MRTKILLTIMMATGTLAQQPLERSELEAATERGAKAGRDAFIASLEMQLAEARKKYKPDHPRVKQVEAALAGVRAMPPFSPSVLPKMSELPEQWWKDPATVQTLGLTSDQQKRIAGVFDLYRDRLIERSKSLDVAEGALDGTVGSGSRNDKRAIEAIDRVAESRAELEKVRGRMLLEMRNQLTPEQWTKISHGPAVTRR